jgi:hypothetical protein
MFFKNTPRVVVVVVVVVVNSPPDQGRKEVTVSPQGGSHI